MKGVASEITVGGQVTETMIRAAMKDAPLRSQQAGGISLPLVQKYVDMLAAGELGPAIKVEGRIIVALVAPRGWIYPVTADCRERSRLLPHERDCRGRRG